jgi:hypothetical protein
VGAGAFENPTLLTTDADWLTRYLISDLLQDCDSMKQYVADRTEVLKASLGR